MTTKHEGGGVRMLTVRAVPARMAALRAPRDGQLVLKLPGVRVLRTAPEPVAATAPAPNPPAPSTKRAGKTRQRAGAAPGRPTRTEPRDRTRPGGAPRPGSKPTPPSGPPRLQAAPPARAPLPPGAKAPRHFQINMEVLDGVNHGKIRISSPQARGWATVIRSHPDQLFHAVAAAREEVARAGVAAWQGRRTVMDTLTAHDDPTEPKPRRLPDADELAARAERRASKRVSYGKDRTVRPDQAPPAMWTPQPDGTWQSPKGERWKKLRPGVIEARRKMGLPLSWDEHVAMNGGEVAYG